MKSPRSEVCQSGFTLIELLVALTILSGLMAITYSGFRTALTMWEKGNETTSRFQEQQTSLRILREQIQGAIPMLFFTQEESINLSRIGFEGEAQRMRFISRASWRDGANAIPRWVELSWDEKLTIDERYILPPFNAPAEQPSFHAEQQLFEDVQFSYLRRRVGEKPPEWRATWDWTELRELPIAIGVKYKVDGQWRGMTVALDYAAASWQGIPFQ